MCMYVRSSRFFLNIFLFDSHTYTGASSLTIYLYATHYPIAKWLFLLLSLSDIQCAHSCFRVLFFTRAIVTAVQHNHQRMDEQSNERMNE